MQVPKSRRHNFFELADSVKGDIHTDGIPMRRTPHVDEPQRRTELLAVKGGNSVFGL